MPLDGSIRLVGGHARVAVYTNTTVAVFVGLVAGGLAMASVVFAVQTPDWESICFAFVVCGTVWWCYRRAKGAVAKVVADALDALRTIEPSAPRDPPR
jgi:hypothetical protein